MERNEKCRCTRIQKLQTAIEYQTRTDAQCEKHGRKSAWQECKAELYEAEGGKYCRPEEARDEKQCELKACAEEHKDDKKACENDKMKQCNEAMFIPSSDAPPGDTCQKCVYHAASKLLRRQESCTILKATPCPASVADHDLQAPCLCDFGYSGQTCGTVCEGKGTLVEFKTLVAEDSDSAADAWTTKVKGNWKAGRWETALKGTPNGKVCKCTKPDDQLLPGVETILSGKLSKFASAIKIKLGKGKELTGTSSKFDNLRLATCRSEECIKHDVC